MEFTLKVNRDELRELENQRLQITSRINSGDLIAITILLVSNYDLERVLRAGFIVGMQKGSEVLGKTMELLLNK